MRRFLAAVVLAAAFLSSGTAEAHRLKLFVDVRGTTISGYGFFVGGGRPQGVRVVVRDGAAREVATLTTDDGGRFAWTAPEPGSYVVVLDAGDGHFVEHPIGPERFAPTAASPSRSPDAVEPVGGNGVAPAAGVAERSDFGDLVEASVDRALARRLQPLLEAQAAAEARLRFNDVMGGIGMIVGLAGLAAWGMARRGGGRGT